MKTRMRQPQSGSNGFALVTVVILLVIASVTIGSILTATLSYRRVSESSNNHEKAAFLADAGLRAALVKLNASSDGNITLNQSHGYFSVTNGFKAATWGFTTLLSLTNGQNLVTSTGRYGSNTVVVKSQVALGVGSRNLHALYAHALFAGNSSSATNYVLQIGGTGTGADFVKGDVYSGNDIALSGAAFLRHPESFIHDYNNDGLCDLTDTWHNAYITQVFTNALSQAAFNTYVSSMAPYMGKVYANGKYDEGEAYVDTIGDGVYNLGEPFVDLNGNGVWDTGDAFIDRNGNGVYDAGVDTVVDKGNGQYDAGEEWTEDTRYSVRQNGRYDPAGGYWKYASSKWTWMTARVKISGKYQYPDTWSAELYEDVGDGSYQPEEPFTDQNGVYDPGEQYLDDRNSIYDYGTQARGAISGMPAAGVGQMAATGGNGLITPPNLASMFYYANKSGAEPAGALERWGNDVAVTASAYPVGGQITTTTKPQHIFVRNATGRDTPIIKDANGVRVDDYFFEDPADPSYSTSSKEAPSICKNDGGVTKSKLINVLPEDNGKVYFVDGNLYLHNMSAYSFRFKQPGTRITIVARGNITISDEFYYNADYPTGTNQIDYANFNSTKVPNPKDTLCLIALSNPVCADSGNILIGDKSFGTGGSIHAMLYAEKDFIDNNLDTASQPYLSIFGNMTAGNQIDLHRDGSKRTRLDVTLDERIRDGSIIVPGLPHPVGGQRSIHLDTAWRIQPGTWDSWSRLK